MNSVKLVQILHLPVAALKRKNMVWTRNGIIIQTIVRQAQSGLSSSKSKNVNMSVATSVVDNTTLNSKNFKMANILKDWKFVNFVTLQEKNTTYSILLDRTHSLR